MDELEKLMPDDFWRKAFDEATETPPPRVWDAIEHRINESDGAKVVPLWATSLVSSRPVAWTMGIAASVALVLVGWWLLSKPSETESVMVAHQTAAHPSNEQSYSALMKKAGAGAHTSVEQETVTPKFSDRIAASATAEQRASIKTSIHPGSLLAKADQSATRKLLMEHRMAAVAVNRPSVSVLEKADRLPSTNGRIVSASFVNTAYSITSSLSDRSINRAVFEPVVGQSIRSSRFGQIQRMVWFQPTEASVAPEAAKAKRKSRDVWASASVMSGTFNPMVSVRTTPAITSNYVALNALRSSQSNNSTQQSVSSHPNFSIAYQANVGVQLSDHWSIESGVGYLAGRSTIETPAQLPAASFLTSTAQSGSTNTLYTDIVRNSSLADQTQTPSVYSSNTYSANQVAVYSGQTRQSLTNNYQFVQVPVQVGYQLRPRKRLSLALLGGFITNIFVRNTIGDELVITAKDGIYKPVSLATIMGARIRYRPSRQWSASVAGIYQSSLGLGTSSESLVQTHPTAAGMSFGVDYHF